MKIGVSTSCFYPLETEKALKYIAENGVGVTEVFFNSPSELEDPFLNELREISSSSGTEVVSIHPCGSLGEPYFLFSDYKRRYTETFEFYKKYWYTAEKLGAKAVVLHGDSYGGHISADEYSERLLEMSDEAAKYGVMISHENVNRFRLAMPGFVSILKEKTGGKIKFTFDIKQTVRSGCGYEAMYDAMRGNICNVHISDNSPRFDCMLPGTGEFDFKEFFGKLKADGFDGPCLIEVYKCAYKDYSEIIDSYKFLMKTANENK